MAAMRDLGSYLEPEQVERVIAAATNPRDALLVRIPWRTGVKVSQLIGIKVSDIDFANRTIVIEGLKKRANGKQTKISRLVPIDQGTLDMIRDYLEWRKQFSYNGELLFPISRQRVNQIYWKLGRRAGIETPGDPAVSRHRRLHPQVFRHSFSRQCIKRGMTVRRLQEILGHSSPVTTSVYLQYCAKDLHDDYDRIWGDEESTTG